MKGQEPVDIDAVIKYHWQAGSMPPPAHYEYSIRLGPNGQGEIIFYPDYPQHNPPVWTESFTPDAQALARLHALIATKKILTKKWAAPTDHSIGGSLEYLEINTKGKQVSVPSRLTARDAAAVREIYDAIRELVPQGIWDSLRARRQAFEDKYPDTR